MTSKQLILDLEVGFVSCLCVGEKNWWEYNHLLFCRFESGIEKVKMKWTILYYYYYVCCAPLVATLHPICSPFYPASGELEF